MIDRMRKQANGQHAHREENEEDEVEEQEEQEEEKVPFTLSPSLCVFLLSFALTCRIPSRSPSQLYTVFSPLLLLVE